MGRISTFGQHLYEGRIAFNFVGRRKLWYAISAGIVIFASVGMLVRGFNLGVEFKGGVEFIAKVQTADAKSADAMRQAVTDANVPKAGDPTVTTNSGGSIRIQVKALTPSEVSKITTQLKKAGATEVNEDSIGPTYGKQVADKALTGLIVFLVLVVIFIWAYFREWRMSVAAIVALAHDLLITAGVYAWSGFEVTPATVTGLLTILGYSLYDTVVVFDKVRENTKNLRQRRTTYAKAANLAVNQTLVRSINTSIVALLPVAAILYVGVATLGSGALKDLALSLFVGMAAGAYSSIFIATPLVVQLKSREKEVTDAERREKARSKREVDRYAEVPVFAEDMPLVDEPDDEPRAPVGVRDGEPVARAPRRPEASGSGRVVPNAKAPLSESRAS
ncbi:MAG: protein translocase subunit SecF, partial [Aeromicrobium sp.]|nr:protein translocase subunit SecF [Aeromicrobium sp.]